MNVKISDLMSKDFKKERAARNAVIAGLVEALTDVEWEHDDIGDYCAWCGNGKPHGHASDCKRQAALAAAKPPTPPAKDA